MAAIVPAKDFSAGGDAEALRKAMKGFGTDEETIIRILARRSNEQRQEIKKAFYHEFGRDLIKDLKSELGGNLEKTILGLMMRPEQFDALCLHKAMKGVGTDEAALIEVLCHRSSEQIRAAQKAYVHEHKSDLVSDIKSEVRGDFEKLLVALVEVARPSEDDEVDEDQAAVDANVLYKAGEKKKFGTDEAKFIEIFTQRSKAHLKKVFEVYGQICDYDIERSIDREFRGDIEKALLAIVAHVRDPAPFFAHKLYKSMDGLGTDDTLLQRVIISRSEVDLQDIATKFNANHDKYKKTLQSWIKDDVGGDYEKLLLEILQ